jgi:hypothetical protein
MRNRHIIIIITTIIEYNYIHCPVGQYIYHSNDEILTVFGDL